MNKKERKIFEKNLKNAMIVHLCKANINLDDNKAVNKELVKFKKQFIKDNDLDFDFYVYISTDRTIILDMKDGDNNER